MPLRLWLVVDRRDGSIYARRRNRPEAVRSRDAAPWALAQHLEIVAPRPGADPVGGIGSSRG